ncbi:MAG: hypothetical protein HC794_04885 [Nitrospiraceae bacterium]|nr:hypothetical protein [Nitrospiraceae bacterium]
MGSKAPHPHHERRRKFQIPAELEISSLPALALYRNGEFVKFIGGVGKRDAIAQQVERLLEP